MVHKTPISVTHTQIEMTDTILLHMVFFIEKLSTRLYNAF